MKRNYMGIFAVFIMILLFLGTIQTGSETIISNQKTHILNDINCVMGEQQHLDFREMIASYSGDPSAPDHPTDGPGGSNYSDYGVRITRYRFGARQYWIFEPYGPKPESAPLIVFNHGWSAIHPICYREWIHHLVKRGNIIVYPRYQRG